MNIQHLKLSMKTNRVIVYSIVFVLSCIGYIVLESYLIQERMLEDGKSIGVMKEQSPMHTALLLIFIIGGVIGFTFLMAYTLNHLKKFFKSFRK